MGSKSNAKKSRKAAKKARKREAVSARPTLSLVRICAFASSHLFLVEMSVLCALIARAGNALQLSHTRQHGASMGAGHSSRQGCDYLALLSSWIVIPVMLELYFWPPLQTRICLPVTLGYGLKFELWLRFDPRVLEKIAPRPGKLCGHLQLSVATASSR
jgi:hypothetical protein